MRMKHNTQKPERGDYRPDGTLDVVKVWPTIQGEGPFTGEPSVFVRLAGCNLQCRFCDTDYTSQRIEYTPEALRNKVDSALAMSWRKRKQKLLVITGGEPFRQNLARFAFRMVNEDWRIQIETNGTLFDSAMPYELVHTVCSPKNQSVDVRYMVPKFVWAWKYVLDADNIDDDGLPGITLGAGRPARPPTHVPPNMIYVQPMDAQDPEENERHLDAAVRVCLQYGYRLNMQVHKMIGVE